MNHTTLSGKVPRITPKPAVVQEPIDANILIETFRRECDEIRPHLRLVANYLFQADTFNNDPDSQIYEVITDPKKPAGHQYDQRMREVVD